MVMHNLTSIVNRMIRLIPALAIGAVLALILTVATARAADPPAAPKVAPPAAQRADGPPVLRIAFPDPRLAVYGLPWFNEDKPVLRRLPARLKDTFRPPVWGLAQSPSGGRIRFRTDSVRITISAQNPDAGTMHEGSSSQIALASSLSPMPLPEKPRLMTSRFSMRPRMET